MGSALELLIPRTISRPDAIPRTEPGRSFLLVEDDPDTRYVLEQRLSSAFTDVRIIAAESAEDALELAPHLRPIAVVLDLGLAGMDGFEFARRLRAVSSTTAMVALTGDTRPESHARAAREGFVAFLVKPAGLDDLIAVLERLLQ